MAQIGKRIMREDSSIFSLTGSCVDYGGHYSVQGNDRAGKKQMHSQQVSVVRINEGMDAKVGKRSRADKNLLKFCSMACWCLWK